MPGNGDTSPAAVETPPPCDTCRFRSRCAAERLACEDFSRYISTKGGGPLYRDVERIPTRELYANLHAHQVTRAEQEWRRVRAERAARKTGRASPSPVPRT